MTIGTTAPRVSFTTDGVTSVFPVPIQSYLATDFEVILTSATGAQTTLVLNSSYTLASSGSLQPPEWTLTTVVGGVATPLATGQTLQVFINPTQTQQSQYVQGQQFPSLAMQTNLDRLTQMVQRLQDQLDRTMLAPDGDVAPLVALPSAALRANLAPVFDANGNLQMGVIPTAALTQAIFNALYALAPQATFNTFLGASGPYAQTAAETAAFAALGFGSVVNALQRPGVPDRYTTNASPGTTLMLNAIVIALTQAIQSGGAPVSFLPEVYFVGNINNAGAQLATVTGLTNTTIYGNGAQIVSNTTVASGAGAPVIFNCQNWENVTVDNLWASDTGFDITQTWKGPQLFMLTMTDATDRKRITFQNCRFKNLVTPIGFWLLGGGTGRYRGIKITACVFDTCYNGPSFQELGDEAEIDVTTINCLRNYFPYGVSGHNANLHVWHDGTSTGANACIDIKRYANDTRGIRVKADFHGYTSQFGSLVNLETQLTTGTAAITALGAITGGAGGTTGTYYGVPLTGGSGAGATANVTVVSGAVVRVDIANPGKGYANTDSLSAVSGNIGSVTGFSVLVSAVGAIISDIDIDLHLEDALQLVNVANVPPAVQFRSFTQGGVLNPTTTDRWDRITYRGNAGQGTFQPITIASVMTGIPPGRLAFDVGSFDMAPNVPVIAAQDYPGFIVKLANNLELYTAVGNLVASPMTIDLSKFAGRQWALEVDVHSTSDYSFNSPQTVAKFALQGSTSSAAGLAASIGNSAAVYTAQVSGGTSSTPALGTSGSNLTVSFTNYNGANARARVTVRYLEGLR